MVFGSLIYFYQATGQAGIWLDRTFPMVGEGFKARYPGKKAITIFAQGNANPEIGAGAVKFIADIPESTYGWTIEDTIYCCGINNMDQEAFEELSARAFKGGEMLAGCMCSR